MDILASLHPFITFDNFIVFAAACLGIGTAIIALR
jgi:hypothetical protein